MQEPMTIVVIYSYTPLPHMMKNADCCDLWLLNYPGEVRTYAETKITDTVGVSGGRRYITKQPNSPVKAEYAEDWKPRTVEMPRLASLYWCFLPTMEPKWKERWSAWLSRRRARKGEGAGSITWTQLLRLTTAIHHLHPPSEPRQPSHPDIGVGFPARSSSWRGPSPHQLKTWVAFLNTFSCMFFASATSGWR